MPDVKYSECSKNASETGFYIELYPDYEAPSYVNFPWFENGGND